MVDDAAADANRLAPARVLALILAGAVPGIILGTWAAATGSRYQQVAIARDPPLDPLAGTRESPWDRWSIVATPAVRAEFAPRSEDPARVVLTIHETPPEACYPVQFARQLKPIRRGRLYRLRFAGRAEPPRGLCVMALEGHVSWRNLSLYEDARLTAEWQRFEVLWRADDESDYPVLTLGCGEFPGRVEFGPLEFTPLESSPADDPEPIAAGESRLRATPAADLARPDEP